MKNSLHRTAVWITVLTLGFFPLLIQGVEAADYRVTPSIRLGQGWDSNIFGTSSNEVSDFYSSVTPDLAFSAASPDLSMQLRGSVEGRWYFDHPDVSSAGYSKNVRLTSAWKPTARFSMSPEAYYLETLDSTARSFLVPVDPTVPPLGIANYGLQKSRDFGASIGLLYQVSPLVETAGTVYGSAHQLPDQSGNASDSHTLGADLSIRYKISQSTTAGVYGNGSKEFFKDTPDTQVFGAGLLAGHQISPAFRIDGRVGISFARQTASDNNNSDQNNSSPTGSVAISYADNTFQASLYGNYGYSGTSGAGQSTRQGTIGINLADQFAQRWSWSLGANYQVSRTVFGNTSGDVKTANGTGSIRYAPWEWGTFDLTGNATKQQSDVANGDLTRYSVALGFTLANTYTAF
jgi:hypothetical protein